MKANEQHQLIEPGPVRVNGWTIGVAVGHLGNDDEGRVGERRRSYARKDPVHNSRGTLRVDENNILLVAR